MYIYDVYDGDTTASILLMCASQELVKILSYD